MRIQQKSGQCASGLLPTGGCSLLTVRSTEVMTECDTLRLSYVLVLLKETRKDFCYRIIFPLEQSTYEPPKLK